MKPLFISNIIESKIRKEASVSNINQVLVTVSGGPDSMATLHCLHKICKEIIALHCNFHLRGEESDRDMYFVKEYCDQNDIILDIINFDVLDYLKKNNKISLEMACRQLRHEWFRTKLKETGFQRIVTGHNADDNIETLLINLLRGSGSRGLSGMSRDNGIIWRPFLNLHRLEILRYLEENNINYIVDSTNLECDFRRNFLRNKIIPLLKSQWPGLDTSLTKVIENIEAENKIVEKSIVSQLPVKDQPLSAQTILDYPAPLLLIKRYIDIAGPYSATSEEIFRAILANKPHIRKWKLRHGIIILRNGNLFIEMSHGKRCS